MPRTTSAAVTGRGGVVFHMSPLRMVTVCLRPLSLTTGMPVARSGAGVRVLPGIAGKPYSWRTSAATPGSPYCNSRCRSP